MFFQLIQSTRQDLPIVNKHITYDFEVESYSFPQNDATYEQHIYLHFYLRYDALIAPDAFLQCDEGYASDIYKIALPYHHEN